MLGEYVNSAKMTYITRKYYKAGFRRGLAYGFVVSSIFISVLILILDKLR